MLNEAVPIPPIPPGSYTKADEAKYEELLRRVAGASPKPSDPYPPDLSDDAPGQVP